MTPKRGSLGAFSSKSWTSIDSNLHCDSQHSKDIDIDRLDTKTLAPPRQFDNGQYLILQYLTLSGYYGCATLRPADIVDYPTGAKLHMRRLIWRDRDGCRSEPNAESRRCICSISWSRTVTSCYRLAMVVVTIMTGRRTRRAAVRTARDPGDRNGMEC
jgi:hypothetical protein